MDSIGQLALWILVGFQALVLLELVRQIGILRRRMGIEQGALVLDNGLERGAKLPAFDVEELHTGERFTASNLAGRSALFVFVSPGCQSCRTIVPELARFAREQSKRVRLVTVCSGPVDQCRALVAPHRLVPVLLDPDQRMYGAFRIPATPAATLVDSTGRVRIQGIPADVGQLAHLIDEEGTPANDKLWALVREPEVNEPRSVTHIGEGQPT